MRNWKVWGVLGLLLALVFAVGYGQKEVVPIVPKEPPELTALKGPSVYLTVRESIKSTSFAKTLQLYLKNLDMHAGINLCDQCNWKVKCGCWETQGIAYFFPSDPGETDVVTVYGDFTQKDVYVFAAWFIPASVFVPGIPPGKITNMKCGFGPWNNPSPVECRQIQIQDGPNCPVCTVFWFAVQIPDPVSGCKQCQAVWLFNVENSAMMFVRVTITKAFKGPPSQILPGRLELPPIPPPPEPEKTVE